MVSWLVREASRLRVIHIQYLTWLTASWFVCELSGYHFEKQIAREMDLKTVYNIVCNSDSRLYTATVLSLVALENLTNSIPLQVSYVGSGSLEQANLVF